jgi:hypothetical protein
MKSLWIKDRFTYDGTQLRSLFAYLEHKVQGDSVVAWRGPCAISFEHMVDGEDLNAQSPIAGADMLHFIIEKFHLPLLGGVFLQRYFAAQALEVIREQVFKPELAMPLRREGDDIYWREGKLSISIATVSPVSTLIHFAVNVVNKGAPVKTAALCDLIVAPDASEQQLADATQAFAQRLLACFESEVDSADIAAVKVRWVK